jgi:hypothetical protein
MVRVAFLPKKAWDKATQVALRCPDGVSKHS